MNAIPLGPMLPGVAHQRVEVNRTNLHYIAAGTSGSPVLLVHGFPETWWTFRKLIPLLAASHRVFAVDLRGFGDSDNEPGEYASKTSAEDLHLLIGHLDVGPVHLTGHQRSDRLPPRDHTPRRRNQSHGNRNGSARLWPRNAG